jgi:hypothetical protein
MVTGIGSGNGGIANWADSVFSKLDTKNQGYIDKSDLEAALSKTGGANGNGTGTGTSVDDAFGALGGDKDGKVTKSELTDAMTTLADQLSAQFDAGRMGPPPDGPPPDAQDGTQAVDGTASSASGTSGAGGAHGPHGHHGDGDDASATSGTDSTDSTSTSYNAAADTNGDGKVSSDEETAYEKAVANGTAGTSGTSDANGTQVTHGHGRDPLRALAHALQLLKAYTDNSADNSGATPASTGSSGDAASSSGISVTA